MCVKMFKNDQTFVLHYLKCFQQFASRVVGQVRKRWCFNIDQCLPTAGFDATQGHFPATITDIQSTFVATKSDVFNKIFLVFLLHVCCDRTKTQSFSNP